MPGCKWAGRFHFRFPVDLINHEISQARNGQFLGKSLVQDPSEDIVEAHVSMLEWQMQSRKFGMTAAQLETLQHKSVEVLESLTTTFPIKNGVSNGWNFEKAHSILHKVCELILFRWSENFSTQGPEQCHIDFIKKNWHCTNIKEVFLKILRITSVRVIISTCENYARTSIQRTMLTLIMTLPVLRRCPQNLPRMILFLASLALVIPYCSQ